MDLASHAGTCLCALGLDGFHHCHACSQQGPQLAAPPGSVKVERPPSPGLFHAEHAKLEQRAARSLQAGSKLFLGRGLGCLFSHAALCRIEVANRVSHQDLLT